MSGTGSVVDVGPVGRFGDGKWKIGISSFAVSFLYAFLVMWARTNENVAPSSDAWLGPSLVSGGAYLVGSYASAFLNGGFIFWSMVAAVFIINWITRAIRTNYTYCERNSMEIGTITASPFAMGTEFVRNYNFWDFLIYSVTMIAGSYLGVLFVWWVVGAGVVPFPELEAAMYSPGVFPGLDTAFTARAATVEGFASLFIGAIHLYFMLVDEPRKGSIAGAISLFVFVLLSFNISGGAFDITYWTMAHFASATAGNAFFPGAVDWWWAYLIPLGGYLVGYGLAILFSWFRKYTGVPVDKIAGAFGQKNGATFKASRKQPLQEAAAIAAQQSTSLGLQSSAPGVPGQLGSPLLVPRRG